MIRVTLLNSFITKSGQRVAPQAKRTRTTQRIRCPLPSMVLNDNKRQERKFPSSKVRRLSVLPAQQRFDEYHLMAMKDLFQTLSTSQMFIPRHNVNDNTWLQYFTELGSPSNEQQIDDIVASKIETSRSIVDQGVSSSFVKERKTPVLPVDEVHQIKRNLAKAIRGGNLSKAMHVLNGALQKGLEKKIHPDMIHSLFMMASDKRKPFEMYDILRLYQRHTSGDHNYYLDMYFRVCKSLLYLDREFGYESTHLLVRNILRDMSELNRANQRKCLPILVSSLAQQPVRYAGKLANVVYQYMKTNDISVPPGFYEHVLSLSKYYRQDDLPYHEILHHVVAAGRRPHPDVAINALVNLYPFFDTKSTYTMLNAMAKLVTTTTSESERKYFIDIAVLESISTTAACRGAFELSLLVWDLVDKLQYQPTETLYDNTVIAFLAKPETYPTAFAVLTEMESNGFQISRGLIRSASVALRHNPVYLNRALGHVREMMLRGQSVSVGMINIIVSSFAERGDIHMLTSLLDEFSDYEVNPDENTISFALEALGKYLRPRERTSAEIDFCLNQALTFLAMIDEFKLATTQYIIRDYVELLCCTDEVDTATEVVLSALDQGGPVCNKTIYRVSMANAERKHFEIARELASRASEPLDYLLENISRREQETANT